MNQSSAISASVETYANGSHLLCRGDWTVHGLYTLSSNLASLPVPESNQLTINGSAISAMDSAGAWMLQKCIIHYEKLGKTIQLESFKKEYHTLLHLIEVGNKEVVKPLPKRKSENALYRMGEEFIIKLQQANDFLEFIGEVVLTIINFFQRPKRIQLKALFLAIEETGVRAMPIIALLSFLVGVVLAYQMGLQLKTYGANVFIVQFSGMAVLREFGPLITAIITAGRTSSSFTAQIGMMKMNEEIDALRTFGLSPINRIAIPKIIGLFIAMPLLVLWANAFGVLGSMVMAKGMLGITYSDFMHRFPSVVDIDNYFIGLSKAPVFALIVASVGCFQGFQVGFSADSVGRQTTKSVVQAIFLIIIADAIFSIIFSWQGF